MAERGCLKCGSIHAEQKEIATTGTGVSKLMNLQHNHFLVVYCKSCGYAEFYHKQSSLGSNLLDLFFGK